ncbi:MAG: LysR family transcriptional regulator [Gluconacetobacter diazotrophicus]|nr:LysR family transcriptional regulator [Gluconacetobacter diazotrophicus]
MRVDPNLLILFLAVAERGNLSAAANHLGITRSAVSHSLRRLEDRLGTALVVRTTRSARLTEAGMQLRERLAGPFAEIDAALDAVASGPAPVGFLRLAVASITERILSGPLVASFAEAHPGITIDVTVTDADIDIVEAGFDAGVRLGEVIEQDMIAVPIGGEIRMMAVASPRYLAAHGCPEHPRDLPRFRCIGWRATSDTAPYRWEFEEDGQTFTVQVDPQITTNDPRFMLRSALSDAGITFAFEETFRAHVDRGDLVSILEDYLRPFPGFFLYFPARRHMAPKLRAFVDHLRTSHSNSDPSGVA